MASSNLFLAADMDYFAVQPGRRAAGRRPKLVAKRIIDHAHDGGIILRLLDSRSCKAMETQA
jgi:hypothetical protein